MATAFPTPVVMSSQELGTSSRAMPNASDVRMHAAGETEVEPDQEHALVHSVNANDLTHSTRTKAFQAGSPVTRLPVELNVAVPVRDFRVRNLLTLSPGQLVETQWSHGEDLPLSSGDVQMAWTEFEVVDTRLAVRITRLS